MTKFTVTKSSETNYRVETDIFLSDQTYASASMTLEGNKMRRTQGLSFGYSFSLDLGPASLAKVQALNIGETVTLEGGR